MLSFERVGGGDEDVDDLDLQPIPPSPSLMREPSIPGKRFQAYNLFDELYEALAYDTHLNPLVSRLGKCFAWALFLSLSWSLSHCCMYQSRPAHVMH
jgi:hypothetical protein